MPLKVTKHALEVASYHAGTVVPLGIGTIYPTFFRTNWTDRMRVTTTWDTSISASNTTGAEQRVSLKERPVRTIENKLTALNQSESTSLQMSMMQMQRFSSLPYPIYCDQTILTADTTATSTTIVCDTKNRRFYPGQRVAFVKSFFSREDYGVPATAIYEEIVSVHSGGFEISAPLGYPVYIGYYVYPMVDIHPMLQDKGTLFSNFALETKVTALEQSGPNTIPPAWIGPPDPLYDIHDDGYPIFNVSPNFQTKINQSIYRLGSVKRSGRDVIVNLHGTRPLMQFAFEELAIDREEAWNILAFFDSRLGRAKPFWFVQPLTLWNYVNFTTTYVDVPIWDYMQNIEDFIPNVAFESKDGSVKIREVSGVTLETDKFRLTFTTPFSILPTNVVKTSPAWFCRFKSDSLEQTYTTDSISETSFDIIELQDEGVYEIASL